VSAEAAPGSVCRAGAGKVHPDGVRLGTLGRVIAFRDHLYDFARCNMGEGRGGVGKLQVDLG